jgi:hypothetical protein
MLIAYFLLYLFYGYLAAGLLFGLWFVFRGVGRVEDGMRAASWRMRLILLPGSAALWPLMVYKYLKNK